MLDATFTRPDLTTFTRLDDLGLEVTGQQVEPDRAALACRVVEPDDWCRRCGCQGVPRDTVVRRLAHEPFGWLPTTLLVTVRRVEHVLPKRPDGNWLFTVERGRAVTQGARSPAGMGVVETTIE